MKKNLVKITEGDLRRIVENSVRRIVRENDYDDYDFDNNYDDEYDDEEYDDEEYDDFYNMSVDDKWNYVIEMTSAERVLQELEHWLDINTKEEFLDDFKRIVLDN